MAPYRFYNEHVRGILMNSRNYSIHLGTIPVTRYSALSNVPVESDQVLVSHHASLGEDQREGRWQRYHLTEIDRREI